MKINNKQKSIIKKLGSVIIFNFFITKLTVEELAGLKLKEINHSICKTNVYYKYLLRTHLNQHTLLLEV